MTDSITDGLKWYLVFVLSTSFHEAAHAWAGLRLGDDTAARQGQGTIHPEPHIRREPIGIRILGRKGVLVLNSIGMLRDLDRIRTSGPELLAMIDFNPGHRYADFDPSTDKVATYGLAALVAGGIAGKAGLFKGLLALLVAAKKFVIFAFLAVAAWLRRLFGGSPTKSEG